MTDAAAAPAETVQSVLLPELAAFAKGIEAKYESLCRMIFFWETDEKRLGTSIRFLHHGVLYSMFCMYIFIHTFYPSYVLLCIFVLYTFIVWIHHLFVGGCVISHIEQRLLEDETSFTDPILKLFRIPITPEISRGLTLYTSSIILLMGFMELFSRTVLNVRTFFSL